MLLQILYERPGAAIIKSQAIHERTIARQTKDTRRLIPRLRLARHGTSFDETKTKRAERIQRCCVLIKTRSQTDRITKREAKTL